MTDANAWVKKIQSRSLNDGGSSAGPSPERQKLRLARALGDDERFVRLAMAVMQLREFLALHRKATGRSDVNIRKVLALLDECLSDAALSNRAGLSRSEKEQL